MTQTTTASRKRRPLLGLAIGLAVVLLLFPDLRHLMTETVLGVLGFVAGVVLGAVVLTGGRPRRR